jgi:hypothetical protein
MRFTPPVSSVATLTVGARRFTVIVASLLYHKIMDKW